MRTIKDITILAGRLLIVFPYVLSLFHRFTGFEWTVEYARTYGVIWATVFWVWVATILEIIGVISLISGYKVEIGSLSLILFIVPVTFIFHGFWKLTGTEMSTQMGFFISNISSTGGLLLLIGFGAGRFSLDNLLKKKKTMNWNIYL